MKYALGFIAFLALILTLEFGFGMFGVFYTKTIKKEMQNAEREVFEQSQSYFEAKRQDALKYYREYNEAESEEDKELIRSFTRTSFANFNENKLESPLREFVYNCKYK